MTDWIGQPFPLYSGRYRSCPKCGFTHVSTQHTRLWPHGEALRRTCGQCGYVWNEEPLDSPERLRSDH